VDSVIALFRVDFSGRGELAERQVLYCNYLTMSNDQASHEIIDSFCFIYLLKCMCSGTAAKTGSDAVPPYKDC
jgi:hypothetical protein